MRNDDRYNFCGREDPSDLEEEIFRDEALPRFDDQDVPLPTALQHLRSLSKALSANGLTEEKIFRREAELVAAFEYDDPADTWLRYGTHMSYDEMSDKELLAYFGWRTRIRRGEASWVATVLMRRQLPPPVGFLLLYIFELLNGIGVRSSKEAREKIQTFRDEFGGLPMVSPRVLQRWLDDLTIRDGGELCADALGTRAPQGQESFAPTFDELWSQVKAEPEKLEYVEAFFAQLDERSTYHPLKNDFGKKHDVAIVDSKTKCNKVAVA